jgi:hypothetical protein
LRRTGEPQKCHKLTGPETSGLRGTPPAAADPAGAAAEPDADADAEPEAEPEAELDAEPDAAAEPDVAAAELAGATADEDAAAELAGAAADEDADGAVDAPLPLAHAARIMLSTVNNVAIRHHEPCFFAFIAISFLLPFRRKKKRFISCRCSARTAHQVVPLYRAQAFVTLGNCISKFVRHPQLLCNCNMPSF